MATAAEVPKRSLLIICAFYMLMPISQCNLTRAPHVGFRLVDDAIFIGAFVMTSAQFAGAETDILGAELMLNHGKFKLSCSGQQLRVLEKLIKAFNSKEFV